jgi:hypothetical protein
MTIILLTKPNCNEAQEIKNFLERESLNNVFVSVQRPDDIEFELYNQGICVNYPYILRERHFTVPSNGIINIHTSFLPKNRGAHPNVWAIIDGTKAGITIHQIDASIDAGTILWQEEIPISPTDTGYSLYNRLQKNIIKVFTNFWGNVALASTFHLKRELLDIQDLEQRYGEHPLHAIINDIRACTFDGYRGTYIRDSSGRKIYLKMELYYDD